MATICKTEEEINTKVLCLLHCRGLRLRFLKELHASTSCSGHHQNTKSEPTYEWWRMKQRHIIKSNQKHLAFSCTAGIEMDEAPFLNPPTNIRIKLGTCNYRSITSFDEYIILQSIPKLPSLPAGPMGVWATSQVMKQYPSCPLPSIISVAPLSSTPSWKRKGSLHFSERDVQGFEPVNNPCKKFQRRMCVI